MYRNAKIAAGENKVKFLIAILLLTPVLAHAKWKPNPADYPVTIHVHSSELTAVCRNFLGNCPFELRQHLNVVIDGKKYEMNSTGFADAALVIGDYKAKLLDEDSPSKDNPPKSYEYHQKYEFLFPDDDTRKYVVVGASE